MKIKDVIKVLQEFDTEADAQIYDGDDETGTAYYDIGGIVPIAGLGDAIIEIGVFRAG